MKDVISVIVPVYNVSAYLPECLDSILSQDYDKLEVILIDDGSTDDSGAVCDAYAQRDGRIRVIHQKNGGAAAAKNAGLRAAAGEYLSFADSDDFLEPGAYAYMMSLLKENGADIVRCAFQNRFRTRTEQWLADESRCVMEGKAFLARFATDWTCGLLWNKLYKRALFDGIFFAAEYCFGESCCGAVTGCVFINVIRCVKMRNARPFAGEFFIGGKSRAVVGFVAFQPVVFKVFCLQAAPGVNFSMSVKFKFGKLYLAVNRSAHCFQKLVDKINFLLGGSVGKCVFQE